jgi:hypothetical protein
MYSKINAGIDPAIATDKAPDLSKVPTKAPAQSQLHICHLAIVVLLSKA